MQLVAPGRRRATGLTALWALLGSRAARRLRWLLCLGWVLLLPATIQRGQTKCLALLGKLILGLGLKSRAYYTLSLNAGG